MNWLYILNEGEIRIANWPKLAVAYSRNHSVCIKIDECRTIVDAMDLAVTECYEFMRGQNATN